MWHQRKRCTACGASFGHNYKWQNGQKHYVKGDHEVLFINANNAYDMAFLKERNGLQFRCKARFLFFSTPFFFRVDLPNLFLDAQEVGIQILFKLKFNR